MAKRILAGILAISMLFCMAFGISACANHEKPTEGVTLPADETAEAIESLKKQIAELQTLIKNLTDKYTEDNEALTEQIKKLQALNMELSKRLDALEGKPVLDKEIEAEIRTAYYNLYKDAFDEYALSEDDMSLRYYGKFSNSYVMFIDSILSIFPSVVSPEVIEGVTFEYGDPQRFEVYCNGKFYAVQQAYDNGLLTHDNLVDIAYNLKNKIFSFC